MILTETAPASAVAVRLLEAPPAALEDQFGRVHDDLRISITDRCNLRCVYCMEEEGQTFQPREQLLSLEEITRVAVVAKRLGVRAVRLTGGEPLVRRDVVDIVAAIAEVGFDDLSLTTNGTRLARLAPHLAAAGLHRVNVSCDSLDPQRFASIRRRGRLSDVLASMDAAEEAGLSPVKVNVVLMAGVNDEEICSFADLARRTGRVVRFIEFMPLDAHGTWRRDHVVDSARVLEEIGARWPLEAVHDPADPSPATRYRFCDGAGEIGVIATVTEPFCATCNRLRLTADGAVRNCLFSDDERSARAIMRNGGSDEDLAALFRSAVHAKRAGHGIGEPTFIRSRRSMSMIGG